jgi:hypothetical protein
MKTNDKAELIAAALVASANTGDDFWADVQDKLSELEDEDKDRVKPRQERE